MFNSKHKLFFAMIGCWNVATHDRPDLEMLIADWLFHKTRDVSMMSVEKRSWLCAACRLPNPLALPELYRACACVVHAHA